MSNWAGISLVAMVAQLERNLPFDVFKATLQSIRQQAGQSPIALGFVMS